MRSHLARWDSNPDRFCKTLSSLPLVLGFRHVEEEIASLKSGEENCPTPPQARPPCLALRHGSEDDAAACERGEGCAKKGGEGVGRELGVRAPVSVLPVTKLHARAFRNVRWEELDELIRAVLKRLTEL